MIRIKIKKKVGETFVVILSVLLIFFLSGCGNGYSYNDGVRDIRGVEAKYLEIGYVPAESLEDYKADMGLLKARVASKGNSKNVQAVITTIEFKINSAAARGELISVRSVSKGGIICAQKTEAKEFYSHSGLAAQYTKNAADNLGKLLTDYKSLLDEDTQALYSQQKINLDATARSIESGVQQMQNILAECK